MVSLDAQAGEITVVAILVMLVTYRVAPQRVMVGSVESEGKPLPLI